jgi:hypothetical protein
MSFSGSFSRIILPIVSGYVDTAVDNGPFNIVLLMLSTSYLFITLCKPQLKLYIEEGHTVQNVKIEGIFNKIKNLWIKMNFIEKIQCIVMVFLIVFSIVDLLILAGHFNGVEGWDVGTDQGLDLD